MIIPNDDEPVDRQNAQYADGRHIEAQYQKAGSCGETGELRRLYCEPARRMYQSREARVPKSTRNTELGAR